MPKTRAPAKLLPKPSEKMPAKPSKRVPVLCTDEQHARYTRVAAKLGGIELAPLFRLALDKMIREEKLD